MMPASEPTIPSETTSSSRCAPYPLAQDSESTPSGYWTVDAPRSAHSRTARSLNPDIPYSLLAFAPQFFLHGLPTTSRRQAQACLRAARQAGLKQVRLGNRYLLRDE